MQRLTAEQIVAIYTGKLANWKQVGGRPAPIQVFYPRPGQGSYSLFMEYFKLREADVKSDPAVKYNDERIHAVKETPNAIVFISVGDAERALARGEPIKPLAIDYMTPSTTNIRQGIYPLSRPLTLITKDPPAGRVKDFIEFALSPKTTDLIVAYNFVPYLD